MKINIKDLTGKTTSFTIDPSLPLENLKSLISSQYKTTPDCIKLILNAKILLPNHQKICDFNIKENDTLILMIFKVFLQFRANYFKRKLCLKHMKFSSK